ncbi:MAG: hypothetical protein ACRENU_16775 [Gemmatimonadaceae bacterium]
MPDRDDKHPLHPTLRAAESKLKEALDEVCEDTDVKAHDTGELIRIEETLDTAREEAKRAISLRRRIKRDG